MAAPKKSDDYIFSNDKEEEQNLYLEDERKKVNIGGVSEVLEPDINLSRHGGSTKVGGTTPPTEEGETRVKCGRQECLLSIEDELRKLEEKKIKLDKDIRKLRQHYQEAEGISGTQSLLTHAAWPDAASHNGKESYNEQNIHHEEYNLNPATPVTHYTRGRVQDSRYMRSEEIPSNVNHNVSMSELANLLNRSMELFAQLQSQHSPHASNGSSFTPQRVPPGVSTSTGLPHNIGSVRANCTKPSHDNYAKANSGFNYSGQVNTFNTHQLDQSRQDSSNSQQSRLNSRLGAQWMLKDVRLPSFSGYGEKQTPSEFLAEFERFASARPGLHIDEVMSLGIPNALKGEAARWWRFTGGFTSWADFRRAFNDKYEAADYQDRLKRDLEERSQHPDEPLSTYIQVIHDFYEKLDGYHTDAEKVNRVLRQMHPEYIKYTFNKTYRDLYDIARDARTIQEAVYRERRYKPPPGPAQFVEPSLAHGYIPPSETVKVDYERSKPRGREETRRSQYSHKQGTVGLKALDPRYRTKDNQLTSGEESEGDCEGRNSIPDTRQVRFEERTSKGQNWRQRDNSHDRYIGHNRATDSSRGYFTAEYVAMARDGRK